MRRIRKAKIEFISLVPAGANKIQPVYKDDGSIRFSAVVKASDAFDEKGELTAVVYAPEMRDSQGDIADAEVIKQMAHDFIANGAKIDIRHDGKAVPAEKARIGETFLVQKTDTRFHGWKDRDNNPLNLEGAWATVIKIDDPELRKKYRSGEWAGVSMGGTAIVDQEKADIDRLIEALTKAVNPPKPRTEETQMEAKEMKELLKEFATELVKALKPEAPKAEKPETPKPEDAAPVFKGDWENERQLTLHARKVRLYELKKGTDFNDPQSVMDYSEAVKTLKADWKAEDEANGIEDQPARKGPAPRAAAPVTTSLSNLSKSDADMASLGAQLAKAINVQRGFEKAGV